MDIDCVTRDEDEANVPGPFEYVESEETLLQPGNTRIQRSMEDTIPTQDEDEAHVPQPFQYIEFDAKHPIVRPRGTQLLFAPTEEQIREGVHKAQPYPKEPPIKVPADLEDLPLLKYDALDPDKDPIRLLALLPHHGEPDSIVQGTMFNASLIDDHYCYLAVRNTRGHPAHTTTMIINGQRKTISRNVDVFLRNFRTDSRHLLLYIREICVNRDDPTEVRTYLNVIREKWIFEKSCRMLNMDDFMEEEAASEAVRLAPEPNHKKDWSNITRNVSEASSSKFFPKHFPIRLDNVRMPPIPYSYLPLDIVAGEIRMLALVPAENESDPLAAHLAHEPIYGPCAYACLSYVWGADEPDCEMLLNGQTFKIRRNLDAVLRTLRRPNSSIVIWIDALCINQADVRERNRQIPRMFSIYENAEGVILWLGPSGDESDIAMDFIQEAYENPTKEILLDKGNGNFETNFSPRNCRAFAAVCRLLQRPYFTRAWMVQEVAMASNPTFWCGNKRMGWSAFLKILPFVRNLIVAFQEHILEDGQTSPIAVGEVNIALGRANCLIYHRNLQETGQRASLLHLTLVSQWADSTNPRDKLYALWDLANDTRALGMKPNYMKTVSEVYMDFVIQFVRHYQSLDIICATQSCDCAGEDAKEVIPSWCPDWRHKPVMETLLCRPGTFEGATRSLLSKSNTPVYSAARRTLPEVTFIDDNRTLVCAAIHSDTISHVVERSPALRPDILSDWRDIARKHTNRRGAPLPEADIDHQFWSMIFGDPDCAVLMETSGEYMRITKMPESLGKSPLRTMEKLLQARTLAFTTQGFMALVPIRAQVGMRVSILLGCSLPVLLAECGDHVHLKGSCFVQGWMKGEVLDGMGMADEEICARSAAKHMVQIC